MITASEIESLVGQDVLATHWLSGPLEGRLVGYCDQPSVILEIDGERFTYAVGALENISPAPPRKGLD